MNSAANSNVPRISCCGPRTTKLTREQELVLFTLSTFAAKSGTRYEVAERCGLDPDHIEDVLDELEELGFSKNTGEVR